VLIASHTITNAIAIQLKYLNGYGRVKLYSKKDPLWPAIAPGIQTLPQVPANASKATFFVLLIGKKLSKVLFHFE
jgi:hypothetical protein